MTFQSSLLGLPGTTVAELTIDGLAICCFNRRGGFWEVAFVRPETRCHTLKISVRTFSPSGVLSERDEEIAQFAVPEETRSIDIRLTDGSNAHLEQFPGGAIASRDFSRNGPNSDDVGWAINFVGSDVPHGEFVRLTPGRVPVTIVRIYHSLLYTKKPTDAPVILSPRDKDDPKDPDALVFGRTNEALGVALKTGGETSAIEIAAQPPTNAIPSSLPAGNFYQIAITNMDQPNQPPPCDHEFKEGYVKGDLHHLYEIIEVSGRQHDLWAPRRRDRTSEGDCHPPIGGHPNLITFEPLIEP